MDNTKLHHLAEAILSAVNDKNYNASRDLTVRLFNALKEAGFGEGYAIEWNEDRTDISLKSNALKDMIEATEGLNEPHSGWGMTNLYAQLFILEQLEDIVRKL